MSIERRDINIISDEIQEKVLLKGNLADLTPKQKIEYILKVCECLNLNPLLNPFQYITFQGKTVLYATRGATDQLRKIYNVSVIKEINLKTDTEYSVKCYVELNNRKDVGTGVVNIKGLQGDMLCNAMMKAETKAKRRATLSICGLGMIDESEIETIPNSHIVSLEDIKKEKHCIDKIEKCTNMDELRIEFEKAKDYAKSINNQILIEELISVKDMKKEYIKHKEQGENNVNSN
jgi:hypothetical protein